MWRKKLANLAIDYSIGVKEGDLVVIRGWDISRELILELYREILKRGAYPVIIMSPSGSGEIFFKYAKKHQIEYIYPYEKWIYNDADKLVSIYSDYNTRKLQLIEPEKLTIFSNFPERRKLQNEFYEKAAENKVAWVLIPDACNALAQEAGMDIYSYTDFVISALKLDYDDPITQWKKVEKEQQRIVEYLNKVKEIKVVGEDTDLTLSVEGRKWINCCGHENLPDGEVFTGPVEDSVNGHIRFTYPGIYQGKEIENIYLEFKDGKVVKADATKGKELLQEVLKVDGAEYVGEFAIGTNYGIKKFTKNMLFDEKMGGTLHMALGMGYAETGSKNKSGIHWDILKDMKIEGSKIIADGTVIYENGKWQIPE